MNEMPPGSVVLRVTITWAEAVPRSNTCGWPRGHFRRAFDARHREARPSDALHVAQCAALQGMAWDRTVGAAGETQRPFHWVGG